MAFCICFSGSAVAAERVPVLGLIFPPHGRGVPEEFVPRLFDRYSRGDETRRQRDGVGLGLFLAALVLGLGRSPPCRRLGGHMADEPARRSHLALVEGIIPNRWDGDLGLTQQQPTDHGLGH